MYLFSTTTSYTKLEALSKETYFHYEIISYMKESDVQVRCPACRKLILKTKPNEDGQLMGFLYSQCRNSRCKKKTEFVLYKNKSYILNKDILKKSFINEISSSTDELTRKFYLNILSSVNE